jgi:hypothetical protein
VKTLTGLNLPILKVRGSLLPVKRDLCTNAAGVTALMAKSPVIGIAGNVASLKATPTPLGGYPTPVWVTCSLHPAFLVRGGGSDNPGEEQGKSVDELKPCLGVDARRAAIESSVPHVPLCVSCASPGDLPAGPPDGALVSVDIEGANGRPNIVGVSWEEGTAYVMPWTEELRVWLTRLFARCVPTFHNAAFDVPELELAGVTPPKVWIDTINLAALYDPDQPMNLQWQVLTHVPGSTAWKGLVNHEKGPDFEEGTVKQYRTMWRDILLRLGREHPQTGQEWYHFYNCLDVCYSLSLYYSLRRKLEAQR